MVGPRFGHRRRRHGAHGSGAGKLAHDLVGLLPDAIADPLMQKAGIDRLAVLLAAVDVVRRGGTVSISGVYGRHPPARRRRGDPLGTMDLATHRVPLDRAPEMYETFQEKGDGAIKVVLQP